MRESRRTSSFRVYSRLNLTRASREKTVKETDTRRIGHEHEQCIRTHIRHICFLRVVRGKHVLQLFARPPVVPQLVDFGDWLRHVRHVHVRYERRVHQSERMHVRSTSTVDVRLVVVNLLLFSRLSDLHTVPRS